MTSLKMFLAGNIPVMSALYNTAATADAMGEGRREKGEAEVASWRCSCDMIIRRLIIPSLTVLTMLWYAHEVKVYPPGVSASAALIQGTNHLPQEDIPWD